MKVLPLPTRQTFSTVAALSLAFLSTLGSASAVLYDFNTTNQLDDYFNKGTTSGSGTGSLTTASSGGLSNSGSLAIPTAVGNDSFLYTTKSAFSSIQPTFVVSVYFQAKAATIAGAALTTTIGLVDQSPTISTVGTAPVGIPDASAANSFTLSLRNAGSGTGSGLSYSLSSYNNAASLSGSSSSITLTDGSWYQLSATYVYNGSGSYTLTGQIYSSDSSGVLGAALLTTAPSWTATNTGLSDGDVYGLLSSQNGNRRGLGRLDNMALVPEPSTVALVGLGLFASISLLRRRRQVQA